MAYPAFGAALPGVPTAAKRPPRPRIVLIAALLILVGALLEVVGLIIGIKLLNDMANAYTVSGDGLNDFSVGGGEGFLTVQAVISVGLWVWMGFAIFAGQSWARILCSVLFGLYVVRILSDVGAFAVLNNTLIADANGASVDRAPLVLTLLLSGLVGLVALVLIWVGKSGSYFIRPVRNVPMLMNPSATRATRPMPDTPRATRSATRLRAPSRPATRPPSRSRPATRTRTATALPAPRATRPRPATRHRALRFPVLRSRALRFLVPRSRVLPSALLRFPALRSRALRFPALRSRALRFPALRSRALRFPALRSRCSRRHCSGSRRTVPGCSVPGCPGSRRPVPRRGSARRGRSRRRAAVRSGRRRLSDPRRGPAVVRRSGARLPRRHAGPGAGPHARRPGDPDPARVGRVGRAGCGPGRGYPRGIG